MFSSVAQLCPTLCDPMNRSTPGLPVRHQLPKFTQTHVHRVSDAIQPSHPLSSARSRHIAYWVRICNSSILSLPGASVRNSAHDKGHEEGGSAYTKAGSSLRSPPGNSRASTPQTRVCLLSALCFHLHLWLYGGCPPLPRSEKRISLQLQLIIPGCDSVSTYKLLWKSSSLPE